MKLVDKLHKYSSKNLRAVSLGMTQVLRSGKNAIARSDAVAERTFTRIYATLLGAWAECRLLKLLHEPSAFEEEDRQKIMAKRRALDRWEEAVKSSFRRKYSKTQLSARSLGATAYSRLQELEKAIDDELRPVIELRNKLAHGQWIYPLNNALNGVSSQQYRAINEENLLTLKQKGALINSLCDCLHDLAVSRLTFERDFDRHFRVLEQTKVNIQRKSYERWSEELKDRYKKGTQKRSRFFNENGR